LGDVHFGDVWVCSGQSNMEWPMSSIFDGNSELGQIAANYPNIRMFKVKHMTSESPQDDLAQLDWSTWKRADETLFVSGFSAVCLLTARYMADVLGKEKVLHVSK
jgi:sialate O-acetylesterase